MEIQTDNPLEGINWDEDPVTGLELPDPPPLDMKHLLPLSFPRYQDAWEIPLADMLKISYEDELDMQVHGVVDLSGVSVLGRWHSEPPKLLHAAAGTIDMVEYEDLPDPAREWFSDKAWWMTEGLSPLVDAFWPLVDSEWERAGGCAIAVRHLPVVVVELAGWLGFALTGAGMNLSAQIGEAYMRCGFYPPAELSLVVAPQNQVVNSAILESRMHRASCESGSVLSARIQMGQTP